jgi:hypothetical protein
VGKLQDGGREIMRKKGEGVRDCAMPRNGCGVGHKFDRWSNFLELRKG